MRHPVCRFLLPLCFAVVLTGCSGETDSDAADAAVPEQEKDVWASQDIVRKSMVGRWITVYSPGGTFNKAGNDLPANLLEISKDGEAFQVKILNKTKFLGNAELVKSLVTDNSARLVFESEDVGRKFDFEGKLDDNLVWGTVMFDSGLCVPVRLIPTEADDLADLPEKTEPYGKEAALAAFESVEDCLQKVLELGEKYPTNPVTLEAFNQTFWLARELKLDEDQAQKMTDAYLAVSQRWGPRMEQFVRLRIAYGLGVKKFLPDFALKSLKEAEKNPKSELMTAWKQKIVLIREKTSAAKVRLQAIDAMKMVDAGIEMVDAGKEKEGIETLHKLHDQYTFDSMITFVLAKYHERKDERDEAMELYAKLAALPMLEMELFRSGIAENPGFLAPSDAVALLWEAKHGSLEGLEDYLNKIYAKHVLKFAAPPAEPRATGGANRVVLFELFTGSQCPPCIAADLATAGLEKTYPKSDVVVLRYHQHIPGADPLANEDSVARFFYYMGPGIPRGTPTLRLNGATVQPVGMLEDAARIYNQLRESAAPVLAQKSDLKFSLSANAKDGELSISANVEGLPQNSKNIRLRLALTEDHITFAASNGIRLHEMIVRSMPGGVEGIEPDKGRLSYSETIKLAQFKQNLVDYLADYEYGQGDKFAEKPLELKKLHLVAFVQDGETQEVLQTAAIPVTGTLDYRAEKNPAEKETKQESPTEKPVESSLTKTSSSKSAPEAPQGPTLKTPETN